MTGLSNAPITLPTPPVPDTQEIAARLAIIFAGRYLILRLIGIGGMASVYLVRHRIHHGLFAVKVLHPAHAEQPELLARFRREGLLCARLAGHPNIAPVLDVGEREGLHYLIMPYIRGEDLDHLLARVGPLSFDDAILAVIQVNEALLYAWRKRVLHCDLTPGNIRLNEFGLFMLVDFGLASTGLSRREPVLLSAPTPHPGTPLYMSPEQILGYPIDIRSDLYALGAILYELLTGEAAFAGSTLEEIERKHLEPTLSLSHPKLQAHPGVEPLLKSLLARSPDERFADPIALQQALRHLTAYPTRPYVCPKIEPEKEFAAPRRRLSFS
ncbi:MAG TPA: serine/threonine-protein kinase [Edaphobacter sp.]|jgi:eukaryotic-like serine/threonine-protein kinase|nr:serine/threonine-protein kinase [Edaphobacter sp.]